MKITAFAKSSVGKKILMALTGLAWTSFVVIHLLGNLTLFSGPEAFNHYAHFLTGLFHGWFVRIADLGLVVLLLIHTRAGVQVWLQKRRARKDGYEMVGDAGGPSQKSLASKTMIFTGPVLLVFIVLHVLHFKFGPNAEAGYVFTLHGEEVRDIYRLVVEEFKNPLMVAGYVFAMVLLGFHLSHGIWSALQSLGATRPDLIPGLARLSLVLGVVLAFGFLYIPIHIYFFVDPPTAAAVAGGAL